jgi:uncharacterized protein
MKYLSLFLLLTLTACTSLFYHPTKEEYFNVDTAKIERQEIHLTTQDQKKLNGWYFPRQKESKGLVLFFHGNAENITSHFVTLFWFVEEGYDYALFDYRGYGKSEGSVDNDKVLLDVAEMIKWGQQTAKAKNLPLIIYGQSLGGTLVTKYLSIHPEVKPDALIVEASLVAMAITANCSFYYFG